MPTDPLLHLVARSVGLLFVALAWVVNPLRTHAQAPPERAVAIVYDDSGSMDQGGRWWYANYAYQTLVALLDKKDVVRLVTMSEPTRSYPFDLADQTGIIRRMQRQRSPGAGTPYRSVQTAASALQKETARSKWLVVISDGSFDGAYATQMEQHAERFRSSADGARVLFLIIGSSVSEAEKLARQPAVQAWRTKAQATVYTAASASDIVPRMQQIAADITSRTLGASPAVSVQGSRIELRSEFPLRRLTVFEQSPTAQRLHHVRASSIQSGSDSSTTLSGEKELDVAMPDASRDRLHGRITHIQAPGDQVIPAGRLTLTLDRPAAPNDLKVLPEVAARLSTSLVQAGGVSLKAKSSIYTPCFGDTLKLRATLIAPAGDTLLHNVRSSQFEITATQQRADQGAQTFPLAPAASGAFYERTFTMPRDTLTIAVAARYPGYFNFKSKLYTLRGYDCRPPRTLSVAAVEPWEADVTKVPKASPLVVIPRANRQPVSRANLSSWSLTVVDAPQDLQLAITRDSTRAAWLVKPKLRWGWPQLTATGTFPVTVELRSPRDAEAPVRETLEFTIRPVSFWVLWGPVLLTLAALVAVAVYIYGVVTKPRFPSGSEIKYEDKLVEDLYRLPTKGMRRWIVPFQAEANIVGYREVRFRASGNRNKAIVLPVGEQVEGMSVNKARLEPGERDELLMPGDQLRYRENGSTWTYTYMSP